MSREFRFRAWSKKNKNMLSNVGISFSDCGASLEWERPMYNPDNIPMTYPLCEYELMQFTGLKDKNGKEICEGDVVNHCLWHDRTEVRQVIYREDLCGFLPMIEWAGSFPSLSNHLEIIGNVWENPELT